MAVLLDSGFLLNACLSLAQFLRSRKHQVTIKVLESVREPIVLPVPAITEVANLGFRSQSLAPPQALRYRRAPRAIANPTDDELDQSFFEFRRLTI